MEAKVIQKYKGRSMSWLKAKARVNFNRFIRERDKDKGCISCGKKVEHAGHFYSGGHYPELKYNENNCHGQCVKCNYFLSGNLNEYRKKIITRISEVDLDELDLIVGHFRRNTFKWDRHFLIEVIEKYK